ncbi:MAG: transcription-repair coupling factor [Armatimonadetes bacterium]|nr:transcription-repair coupling factor [Armatimonadota bacterium]
MAMLLQGLVALLRGAPAYKEIRHALIEGAVQPSVLGPGGSAAACLLAAIVADPKIAGTTPDGTGAPAATLVITPNREAAERLTDDLRAALSGAEIQVVLFPDDPTAVRDRLGVLDALTAGRGAAGGPAAGPTTESQVVVVASAAACAEPLPSPEALAAATLHLRPEQTLPRDRLVAGLESGGYQRVGLVANPGEFAVRGGVVDLFPPDADAPVRLDLWGDEVDSLRAFDPLSQRGLKALPEVTVRPAWLRAEGDAAASLAAHLPSGGLLVFVEPAETMARIAGPAPGRRRLAISAARPPEGRWHEVRLDTGGLEAHGGQTHLFARMLTGMADEGLSVVIASAQADRLAHILADSGIEVSLADRLDAMPPRGRIVAVPVPLARGFRLDSAGLAVATDAEIVGWRRRRPRMRFLREGERLASWVDLSPGDLVVHLHHGIGRYKGLVRLQHGGAEREYLMIEYAAEDRLYVPTDQIGLVQRYIGAEGAQVRIHRLSGAEWEREKRQVKEATREMAASLLTLYAARATAAGHAFGPDTPWQHEMEAAFPYEETPHQRVAIEAVKRDMEAPRPMDRLVAGDVGYGKTEVALRAAFKAVMDGRQVAVVVPTTVLAQQHFNVFCERFAPYPVTVELLSRFRSPGEQKTVLAGLAAGTVDVVIGTHRLLGKDVRFANLGLVIVDEEQRFGVGHKEHLKTLRRSVDVLTLTATPIPRTLHMSLAGLRDLTVMETPPEARLPIHTEIRPQDDDLVRDVIRREIARGGQVYVVHNRVETIGRAARRIRHLVPEARVGIGHGRMSEERLETTMLDFLGGRLDVLVCTTIVEIGLDIQQVNTILIEDAQLMGLAQLYQLRGRVGRADRQAYCYLLYPPRTPLTAEAEQRLRAMAEFVELGSGMGLAMRDLEIRGAGNILGPEQHGHVAAVGFDLYCRLLDEAIREARGEIIEDVRDPALELGVDAHLPVAYLPDENERMACYRRLAAARTTEETETVAAEMEERYGPPPPAARALLEVVRLRIAARGAGVTSIARQDGRFAVRLNESSHLDAAVQDRLRLALGSRAQVTAAGLTVRASGRTFAEQVGPLIETLDLLGRLAARGALRYAGSVRTEEGVPR